MKFELRINVSSLHAHTIFAQQIFFNTNWTLAAKH
jgi:hypothetical protein